MFCGNCGKELKDDAEFCGRCGAVQPYLSPKSQNSMADPMENQPVVPVTPELPQKEKKKVSKKFLAVIAAVLVLAVVAALVIPKFSGTEKIYVPVSRMEYDADGNQIAHNLYEYDELGNRLITEYDQEWVESDSEESEGAYECDGHFETWFEGEYTEDGFYTSCLFQSQNGFSVKYKYDEDGRIAEFTITTEPPMEGEPADTEETDSETYYCEYDKEGNLERVYYLNDDEEECTTLFYEYDKEGRLTGVYTSIEGYTARNDLDYEDGRLSEIEYYECAVSFSELDDDAEFELVHTFTFAYDKKGNLTEIVKTDSEDEEIYTEEREYDHNGFLTESTTRYADGGKYTTEYTRDDYGNAIEIEYPDGSRGVYEYEEREVTHQQALAYRRQYENSELLWGFWNEDATIVWLLIPDPLKG